MANSNRPLWENFKAGIAGIPAFVMRPFKREIPDFRIRSRTGDARYLPQMAVFGNKPNSKLRRQMANRLDDVDLYDYDRARFFPVVKDGIRSIVTPASRANFHFACSRADISELAAQDIGPLIPDLIRQLLKGALEFGYQACEIRWEPKFDVLVGEGQANTQTEEGTNSGRYYPFIWSVKRFAYFHPQDTRILVDTVTGDFAGIRQMIPIVPLRKEADVLAHKCLIFTHDKEFDQNYGVAVTKAAIPFIEAILALFNAAAIYTDVFAVPGMIGRYPFGKTPIGGGNVMDNADIIQEVLNSIENGQKMSLPSNCYDSGERKWGIDLFQPVSTTEPYTALAALYLDQIRMAIGVNEMASSDTVKTGGLGDQGAEDKIGLFLANIENHLDQMVGQVNKLLDQWKSFNFGADAPPLRIYFEPVDTNLTKALLAAVVEILSSGQPIQDAEGRLIYADWAKILQDKGIPTVSVSGKRLAQQLLTAAQQQIGARTNPQGGEGGAAGQQVVSSLSPKPDVSLSVEKARRILLEAVAKVDTAEPVRVKLRAMIEGLRLVDRDKDGKPCYPGENCPNCGASMEWNRDTETCNTCGKPWPANAAKLAEWEEDKHPRDQDGKFARTSIGGDKLESKPIEPGTTLYRGQTHEGQGSHEYFSPSKEYAQNYGENIKTTKAPADVFDWIHDDKKHDQLHQWIGKKLDEIEKANEDEPFYKARGAVKDARKGLEKMSTGGTASALTNLGVAMNGGDWSNTPIAHGHKEFMKEHDLGAMTDLEGAGKKDAAVSVLVNHDHKSNADDTDQGYHTRPGGFLERDKTGHPISKPVGHLGDYKAPVQMRPEEAERAKERYAAASKVDPRLEVDHGPEKKGENLERVTEADTPEIMRTRKAIKDFEENWRSEHGVKDTSHIDTPERRELRQSIAQDLYGDGATKREKKVFLISGPPGSGKSTLVKLHGYARPDAGGALEIDSDQAKELLPEFNAGRGANLVHEESSQIADTVLDRAMANGDNIVHPIVGKSPESLKEKIKKFTDAGYKVHVDNLYIEPHRSAESVAARFHKNGRFVPPEYALSVGSKPLETHRAVAKDFEGHPDVTFSENTSDDVMSQAKPKLSEAWDEYLAGNG